MITARLLFNRGTGLGDTVAMPGEIHPVDLARVREFLASGRAVLAPEEPEPLPASLTSEALDQEPECEAPPLASEALDQEPECEAPPLTSEALASEPEPVAPSRRRR